MKKSIAILLLVMGLSACSGGGKTDPTLYLGTWRHEGQGGRYTILALRNNGSIEIDIRIEGHLSKIVDKSGKATGTWQVDKAGDTLTLDLASGGESIGWTDGPNVFQLLEIDEKRMVLLSPDDTESIWEKSINQSTDASDEAAGPCITLAPLVVSLEPGQSRASQRYKWFCVAMDIQLAPGGQEPDARYNWQDKVILLLSSKTYEDVNKLDKLKKVQNEVKALLNPYMDDSIQEVTFTKTIVTGSQDAVDTFCLEFES